MLCDSYIRMKYKRLFTNKFRHYFHFKVYNFITYLCLCNEEVGRTIPYTFLDDICNLFDPIKNNVREVGAFGTVLQKKMVRIIFLSQFSLFTSIYSFINLLFSRTDPIGISLSF